MPASIFPIIGYLFLRMGKRLRPFWQSPELRFYLTLAFLVWSLMPHYRLRVHTHGGSADSHDHATFSAEGIALADHALQALPDAEPLEFGGEPALPPSASTEGCSWTSGAGLSAHVHLQQDLNSVPVVFLHSVSPKVPLAAKVHDLRYRPPTSAVPAHRPARGPPASFPA